jgi:hypothetical protein
MDYSWYMSGVLDIGDVALTGSLLRCLELLLRFELKFGAFSVYQFCNFLKKTLVRGFAYKNVHANVQKLHNLGLVEGITGYFPRGAKYYKISSRGWFNLINKDILYASSYLGRRCLIDLYDHNIFFKTFFCPYFEKKTIEHFSEVYLTLLLYLDDCLMLTENYLETINKKWLSDQLQSGRPIIIPELDSKVNSFLIGLSMEEVKHMEMNKTSWNIENVRVLSHDRKYMSALNEAKKQFELSYKMLC